MIKITIAEVSKKYNLTQDTLRYYEKIGLIPHVPRNNNGIRNFDEESCRWIEFIKCMRSAGMQLEVLIKYISLFKQGRETLEERRNLLIEQKEKLVEKYTEIGNTINRLENKIKIYDEIAEGKRKDFMEEP